MAIRSSILVIKKDQTEYNHIELTNAVVKAFTAIGGFTHVDVLKNVVNDGNIRKTPIDGCEIGRYPIYIQHPEGDVTFPECPSLNGKKFMMRVPTLYYSDHPLDGISANAPQNLKDAKTFFEVSLSIHDAGAYVIKKVSRELAKILEDYHVYFCERDCSPSYELVD